MILFETNNKPTEIACVVAHHRHSAACFSFIKANFQLIFEVKQAQYQHKLGKGFQLLFSNLSE